MSVKALQGRETRMESQADETASYLAERTCLLSAKDREGEKNRGNWGKEGMLISNMERGRR